MEIKDLNETQLFHDLEIYLSQLQVQCPSFTDVSFDIVKMYVSEIKLRVIP